MKRILSVLMIVCLVVGILSTSVLAADEPGDAYGFVTDNEGNVFYYDPDTGDMVKGWLHFISTAEDSWYFFDYDSGAMQRNIWVKSGTYWYYLQMNGRCVMGDWLQWKDDWYYCQPVSGRMATGWIGYNNNWFYADARGKCLYAWQQINGNWYYFAPENKSGRMVTGQVEIDGVLQQFANDGVWQGPVA